MKLLEITQREAVDAGWEIKDRVHKVMRIPYSDISHSFWGRDPDLDGSGFVRVRFDDPDDLELGSILATNLITKEILRRWPTAYVTSEPEQQSVVVHFTIPRR